MSTEIGPGAITRGARQATLPRGSPRACAWLLAWCALGLLVGPGTVGSASASACSTSSPASSCTISASLTVTAGTLGLESSPNLFWSYVSTGYDQWASGSATALTSCSVSSGATNCSSGSKPTLEVIDATLANAGWAVSEYLTANGLPSGSLLTFNGAGSGTVGNSTQSPIATNPFSATTPATICDFASSCTVASSASSCSHAPLGFTTCPSYPVTMGGTSSSAQVDLYSAAANSGSGAICFASGSATGAGCVGATLAAYYNLGVKSNAAAGTTSVTINMAVNSGP